METFLLQETKKCWLQGKWLCQQREHRTGRWRCLVWWFIIVWQPCAAACLHFFCLTVLVNLLITGPENSWLLYPTENVMKCDWLKPGHSFSYKRICLDGTLVIRLVTWVHAFSAREFPCPFAHRVRLMVTVAIFVQEVSSMSRFLVIFNTLLVSICLLIDVMVPSFYICVNYLSIMCHQLPVSSCCKLSLPYDISCKHHCKLCTITSILCSTGICFVIGLFVVQKLCNATEDVSKVPWMLLDCSNHMNFEFTLEMPQ